MSLKLQFLENFKYNKKFFKGRFYANYSPVISVELSSKLEHPYFKDNSRSYFSINFLEVIAR